MNLSARTAYQVSHYGKGIETAGCRSVPAPATQEAFRTSLREGAASARFRAPLTHSLAISQSESGPLRVDVTPDAENPYVLELLGLSNDEEEGSFLALEDVLSGLLEAAAGVIAELGGDWP